MKSSRTKPIGKNPPSADANVGKGAAGTGMLAPSSMFAVKELNGRIECESFTFEVLGEPIPQGSLKASCPKTQNSRQSPATTSGRNPGGRT